jgi:hypothetical protein
MTLIADILMIAGALGAAFYCMVLSRRLRRFSDLEKGVGGAVAVLSVQVDDMNKTIRQAEKAAAESAARLNELTARSEDAARRLELMIASMHDLPLEADVHKKSPDGPKAAAGKQPEPDKQPEVKPRQTIFASRRSIGSKAA